MLWFYFVLFACFISYVIKDNEMLLDIISQDLVLLSYRQAVLISSYAGEVTKDTRGHFWLVCNKTWGSSIAVSSVYISSENSSAKSMCLCP